jgi:ribose 5-phosphate isomerase A
MVRSFSSLGSSRKDKTKDLFQHIREHFLNDTTQVVGLGSGKTVAGIVSQIGNLPNKQSFDFIVSSLQIKLEAERNKLNVIDENKTMNIQILLDGADQLDSEYHMIKGGGGAIFKEKILFAAAQEIVILADSSKYANKLSRAVPIEVHPFARALFVRRVKDLNTKVTDYRLRLLQKGFPFFTENGNIIFDVSFESISSVTKMVSEIKSIPGVIEVGIFPKPKTVSYYKIHQDDSFEVINFR